MIVWEPKNGCGGHQVALTLDRAETVHRVVSRALPEAECRIEPLEGFGPKVAAAVELRPARRRASSGREGRRR